MGSATLAVAGHCGHCGVFCGLLWSWNMGKCQVLTLKVLVATIDAQLEGMEDLGSVRQAVHGVQNSAWSCGNSNRPVY